MWRNSVKRQATLAKWPDLVFAKVPGRRFSLPRFNLKGGALSFIVRHIVLRAGTNDFEFESPGYRNGRCLGPNVAEENRGRRAVEKERKTGIESWIVGVYRFLFSVAVETFKGQPPPSSIVGNWRTVGSEERERVREAVRKRRGQEEEERSRGEITLRSRQWSFVVTLRSNGHDVCLFRPGCHNTPTTDRSGVLTSVMYLPRNSR